MWAQAVVPVTDDPTRVQDVEVKPRCGCAGMQQLLVVVGVVYVGATLYGSTQFIASTTEFLSNDVFWPAFNASVGAVFVASACNWVLNGNTRSLNVALTDAKFAIASDTAITSMYVTNSPHYPRLLQYHRLASIEDGVAGLRSVPGSSALFVISQYCWVDFKRRWSLAHTERRAERCLEHYADNAAVYLESTLRNVQWELFIESVSETFDIAIASELELTEEGRDFLESVKISGSTSINDEARLWKSHGCTHYTLAYHNIWQVGLEETVSLSTALNLRTYLPIKDIPFATRWTSATSYKMFWGMFDDFWAVGASGSTVISNCSLIRNSSNFYERWNISMEQVMINDGVIPSPFTPTDELFRAAVGPFGSIDMRWVMYPQELYNLVDTVKQVVNSISMANGTARRMFQGVSRKSDLHVLPRRWANDTWLFVGGSPL